MEIENLKVNEIYENPDQMLIYIGRYNNHLFKFGEVEIDENGDFKINKTKLNLLTHNEVRKLKKL